MEVELECRYCLKVEKRQRMLAPCGCDGSQKFVHQSCLSNWLLLRGQCCGDTSDSERMAPQQPQMYIPEHCELCLQPIEGGWSRKLRPRVYWRDGVTPCIRRFIYVMVIFNLMCFVLSLVRLVMYWGKPVTTKVLTEAIADWLDVVLVLIATAIIIILLSIDRCPLLQVRCHQWRWNVDDQTNLLTHV